MKTGLGRPLKFYGRLNCRFAQLLQAIASTLLRSGLN